LPNGFAHRLARSLDAIDAAREPVAARPAWPVFAPRRNLALAGLLAVLLGFGMMASRHLPSRHAGPASAPVAATPAPATVAAAAEVLGEVPSGAPVAAVERSREVAAAPTVSQPAAPRAARAVRAASPRARTVRPAKPTRATPTRATPQPRRGPTIQDGALRMTELLRQPVVKPERHAMVPTRPAPPAVEPVAPAVKPERDRRPLFHVVLPPSEPASRVAAAPSREIPSPRLLNRQVSSAVALDFTTASLAEPSLPRATLPDLEFAGID